MEEFEALRRWDEDSFYLSGFWSCRLHPGGQCGRCGISSAHAEMEMVTSMSEPDATRLHTTA